MRHAITSAAALMIVAMLGVAAAQGQATPPAQQNQPVPQQKENPLPGSPEHQGQVDRAINSESGRAGTREPLPQSPPDNSVFVNGALNVPGAPQDSQTVPSKFSERNATLDKLPTIAAPLWLNDEQRRRIAATLRAGGGPTASVDTPFAGQIPQNVEMLELPDGIKRDIPDVNKLKYVRADDRILLVDPPNRTVVGEIKN
jgi:hypothetical protein